MSSLASEAYGGGEYENPVSMRANVSGIRSEYQRPTTRLSVSDAYWL